MIKNILSYLEPRNILKNCLFLNKSINKLFQFKILNKIILHDYELKGKQNMDTIYCEYNIETLLADGLTINNPIILDVEFEIESKDQGWATLNISNSWVELRLIEKNKENNKRSAFAYYDLVRNYKDEDYKLTKISLLDFRQNGRYILESLRNKNCIIQIVARSEYPGSLCYIRRVNAKFSFFEINLA